MYGYQPVTAVLKSRKRSLYNMFLKKEGYVFDSFAPQMLIWCSKVSFEPLVHEYLDATGRDPVVVNQDFFGNILQDNNHQVLRFFALLSNFSLFRESHWIAHPFLLG